MSGEQCSSRAAPLQVDRYQCCSGMGTLRNAVQLICGDRMCEDCAIELGSCPTCPQCMENLEERYQDGSCYFPDVYIRKEIKTIIQGGCEYSLCSGSGPSQGRSGEVHGMSGHNNFEKCVSQLERAINSSHEQTVSKSGTDRFDRWENLRKEFSPTRALSTSDQDPRVEDCCNPSASKELDMSDLEREVVSKLSNTIVKDSDCQQEDIRVSSACNHSDAVDTGVSPEKDKQRVYLQEVCSFSANTGGGGQLLRQEDIPMSSTCTPRKQIDRRDSSSALRLEQTVSTNEHVSNLAQSANTSAKNASEVVCQRSSAGNYSQEAKDVRTSSNNGGVRMSSRQEKFPRPSTGTRVSKHTSNSLEGNVICEERVQEDNQFICGECGVAVFYTDLEVHRNYCYKHNPYYQNCYRILDGPQEETSLQFGRNDLLFGGRSLSNFPLQPVINIAVGFMRDGIFRQAREHFDNLGRHIERFQSKFRRDYREINSPIQDPIFETMRWQIQNYSRRLCDNTNSLLSCFFYSLNGYKMRLRLDFHQSGPVKTLSLYLLIVQGENDQFLLWPFQPCLVNFGILSFAQSDGVYETPPVNAVLQCHSEDRGNVVCGLQSISISERNLSNDCIFIRCTVKV